MVPRCCWDAGLDDHVDTMPPEFELALAYTPAEMRSRLHAMLAFDQRLARIVAKTTEPMLGQMRLAWWRDNLGRHIDERPTGDAVLDAISREWAGSKDALVEMIDGWEVIVAAEALTEDQLKRYTTARSAPFVKLFDDGNATSDLRISAATTRFACADLASRLGEGDERELAIRCGSQRADPGNRLPKAAAGLGVLEALALRALKRGGRPLMEGRGASLAALRAGFLGR